MGFDLSDYVTVSQRLGLFYEQYPEGRIASDPPEVRIIGDRYFIEVTARAWRTPEDQQPCVASAWEPFPGKTPYTRDSEMMNAETSAIGRCLAAAGIAVNRSLASRDEVQHRQQKDKEPMKNTVPIKTETNKKQQRTPDNTGPKVDQSVIDEMVARMAALNPEARKECKSEFMMLFGMPHNLAAKDLIKASELITSYEAQQVAIG
jgi:hypothetical protein